MPTEFDRHDTDEVDFAELAAQAHESDIDFEELRSNIVASLSRSAGPVTAGQVLAEFPATQGLASIVGLMVLGAEHGAVSADTSERVAMDRRTVVLPTITFSPDAFEDHR